MGRFLLSFGISVTKAEFFGGGCIKGARMEEGDPVLAFDPLNFLGRRKHQP